MGGPLLGHKHGGESALPERGGEGELFWKPGLATCARASAFGPGAQRNRPGSLPFTAHEGKKRSGRKVVGGIHRGGNTRVRGGSARWPVSGRGRQLGLRQRVCHERVCCCSVAGWANARPANRISPFTRRVLSLQVRQGRLRRGKEKKKGSKRGEERGRGHLS